MQTGCCEIECLFYWDGGLRNWLGDISVVDYVVGSEVGKRLQRYISIEKSFYGKFTCGMYMGTRSPTPWPCSTSLQRPPEKKIGSYQRMKY